MTYSAFELRWWFMSSLESERERVTAEMRRLNRIGTPAARAKSKALYQSVKPVLAEISRRHDLELKTISLIDTSGSAVATGAAYGARKVSDAIVSSAKLAGETTGSFAGGILANRSVQLVAGLLLITGGIYAYAKSKG